MPRLPFGMHLPSIIITAVFVLFVYPRLVAMLGNVGATRGDVG